MWLFYKYLLLPNVLLNTYFSLITNSGLVIADCTDYWSDKMIRQSSAVSMKGINQRSSDPEAGFHKTKAVLCQELHRSLCKKYDLRK